MLCFLKYISLGESRKFQLNFKRVPPLIKNINNYKENKRIALDLSDLRKVAENRQVNERLVIILFYSLPGRKKKSREIADFKHIPEEPQNYIFPPIVYHV